MTSIADEALADRVRMVLDSDWRLSGQPIEVRASSGEVFLKGAVDNPELKDIAVFIAAGIPGVRHVNADELTTREVNDE